MSRLASLLAFAAVSAGMVACGGGDAEERASAPQARPSSSAAARAPAVTEGRLGRPGDVPGQANIFGAGHEQAPDPGGGGPGVLPPLWRLPAGADRVVTFPVTTGLVNPIVDSAPENGPGGDLLGPTDVLSHQGISGIVHRRNGMFLVGVFLADDPPRRKAPPRLDFTSRERFRSLAPRIGQTFLIGDGTGRSYRVPPRATRLFLGFADGYLYEGEPGWYDNNAGALSITVAMATG